MNGAVLVLLLACGAGADGWQWRETTTPHFAVSHESPWLPGGMTMDLERLHRRLRLDLGIFAPWMARERIKLRLFKTPQSYQASDLRPPRWSNGLAVYAQRTVAVYEQKEKRKLLELIAHETTHLLFESYWGESGKAPPSWLNEGLAMLEESDVPRESDWYKLTGGLSKKTLPLEEFFSISPAADLAEKPKDVGVWYTQAYAISYFLLRERSSLQFKYFCAHLRDGKGVEESLWLAYRFGSLRKFEAAWKAWLREFADRNGAPVGIEVGPAPERPQAGRFRSPTL